MRGRGDTPPGGFRASLLGNREIAALPLTPMATKIGNIGDTALSYIVSGGVALLVLLIAAKAGWTLWIIGPAAVLIGFYLVHSPRRQRRLRATAATTTNTRALPAPAPAPEADAPLITKNPKARGVIPSRDDRHPGWNSLGILTVRPDDPYVVIKGESPPDGVTVAVAPGRWQVHVRSEFVAKAPVHMRDAEVRIVQDARWVTENWDWTPTWEPLMNGHLGSTAQSGRIAVDAGLLRVQAGRKGRSRNTRARGGIVLQPGFAETAFGVNVVRDLAGNVVAVVSRFG
jgi:hypothetical protein